MRMTSSAGNDRLLLTAREAAAALSISERTLWSITRRGEIAHIACGRKVLYSPSDLDAWIDRQRTNGESSSD